MPSDSFGKRPEKPCLLEAVTVNALLDHDLDSLLELVPYCEPLHVLIDRVARLWGAGITGSILHSKVRLPAVISCWGLAYLILSLLVGKVGTYSRWLKPWRRFGVTVYGCGRGKEREASIYEGFSRYWLCRPPQLVGCYVPKLSSSRSIPCRVSDVSDEYI